MESMNTREYIDILRHIIEDGDETSMIVVGTSMSPFLRDQRDAIVFKQPVKPLKKGDMVFYQRETGQYVMHRIHKITDQGCYMAGDNQTVLEGPIDRKQIFAIVNSVERNGSVLDDKHWLWLFFAGPWRVLRPVRHGIRHVRRYMRYIKRRKYHD